MKLLKKTLNPEPLMTGHQSRQWSKNRFIMVLLSRIFGSQYDISKSVKCWKLDKTTVQCRYWFNKQRGQTLAGNDFAEFVATFAKMRDKIFSISNKFFKILSQ